jgi:single-strand DNA-binding protein
MINKIIVEGRLTKDPELRRTQSGTAVTGFTIACERSFSSGGEKVTDFFDCTAWRNTGEFISKYFSKGRKIFIVGQLQTRTYTDKSGNRRKAYEIVVDEASFGDSKQGNVNNQDSSEATQAQFEELTEDDGDLPF